MNKMFFKYSKINDEPASYKVNGKEVTEEEFKKEMNRTFNHTHSLSLNSKEVTGGLTAPPKMTDCPSKAPEVPENYPCVLKDKEAEVKEEYIPTLSEQIIDKFVEDCYNDKTDYYVDIVQLECEMVVMSIVPKDNVKYITTVIFEDEEEAAEFCFNMMNGNISLVPKKEDE